MQVMNANILQQVPDNPDSTIHYLIYHLGLVVEEAGQKENYANQKILRI